jgi:hypothetical protein
MADCVDLIAGSGNQSPPSPVFSDCFDEDTTEEEEDTEEEGIGEEEGTGEEGIGEEEGIGKERGLKRKRFEEGDINEEEIQEDIRKEHENTSSLISDITKWEKMQQAGQKLSENALTKGTIRSYKK